MRYYETVPERVVERRRDAGLRCDRCGTSTDRDGRWPVDGAWHRGEASEVTLKARIGLVYPEADCRVVYTTDVCPACFVGHVLPALRSAGVTVYVHDAEDARPAEERPA